jgi:hypothetical protein
MVEPKQFARRSNSSGKVCQAGAQLIRRHAVSRTSRLDTREQSTGIRLAVPRTSQKRLTFASIMFKHLAEPLKAPSVDHRAGSLPGATVPGLAGFGAIACGAVRTRGVAHRDGAGHLDPAYEAELRSRVQDRARRTGERAFVSGTSSANPSAEEAGEDFVIMVTGCGNGDSAREDRSEERGGPFVQTSGGVEFADDTDESNPVDATREPFPIS